MKTRRRKKATPVTEEPIVKVDVAEFETVCQVCDAEFLDEEDLKLHVAQVHINESNGWTICELCYAALPGADTFVSHFIFKHLENSLFCFYCYRMFSDSLLLDQHELKHCVVSGDFTVTCSQCSTMLTDRQELQKHEYREHGDSKDGVMLNSFFSLFSSALNMKINKFIDCLYKKNLLVCHKCQFSSMHIKDFIDHLGISRCVCFACDTCCNVYTKKYSIVGHMAKKPQCHNYMKNNNIQKSCPKCFKYFNLEQIRSHKKSCNVIKCMTCDKVFESISDLSDHRIKEHTVKISLETCKFCKKEFVGTLNLKKHMDRTHKDRSLYKYVCVYCGSVYAHPRKLFAHFYTRHKNLEPYTCTICDERFRIRRHFTIHIKLQHKGVGFIEFTKNLHVIFTDKKSKNPEAPETYMNVESTTDASDTNCNEGNEKLTRTKSTESSKSKKREIPAKLDNNDSLDSIQSTKSPDSQDSDDDNISSNLKRPIDEVETEIENLNPSPKVKRRRRRKIVRSPIKPWREVNSPDLLTDDSEDAPLSRVRESLLREKANPSNFKKRTALKDRKDKLTCKICNKFCYTFQNYHHHLTLHEKTKMKRCIKCNEYFPSRRELKNHIEKSHSSSKLIETLKSVLEKRKKIQPAPKPGVSPGESLKSILEKRRKQQMKAVQNSETNKFRRTIRKVDIVDDCTATITPMSDHGLSVKNFIENFKPEGESVSICNSVTIKTVNTPEDKHPAIKMRRFNPETSSESGPKLRFPVKFKDSPVISDDSKVSVKLVQKLITKPKAVNMVYNERIPVVEGKNETDDYCNMFADETDYTDYKNEGIPEVDHEVLLGDPEEVPRIRRLAQEIIIPRIPEEHGGVRIGHLLPQAPYYKIVKVKKLLNSTNVPEPEEVPEDKDVKLPDGTRLISVKNPYAHLIANDHLEELLKKASSTKYYTPKPKNIEKAIAKALSQMKPPLQKKIIKKRT